MLRFTAREKQFLYHELAKLLQAGFPMENALATLAAQKLGAGEAHFVRSVSAGLQEGKSIAESVRAIENLPVSEAEKNLLEAGERGGRLADVARHLGGYFERVDLTRRSMLASMIYPIILLHLALIIPVLPRLVLLENKLTAIRPAIIGLLVVYGLVAAIYFGGKALARRATRDAAVDRVLWRVPLLGKLRRCLAFERFCEVFRIYILAGMKPSTAMQAGGEASHSGALLASASAISQQLADGNALGPLLRVDSLYPPEFARGVATAEASGTLDTDMERWGRHFRLQTQEAFERIGSWLPKILYVLILLFVALQILRMGLNYFDTLGDLLEN